MTTFPGLQGQKPSNSLLRTISGDLDLGCSVRFALAALNAAPISFYKNLFRTEPLHHVDVLSWLLG